MTALRSLLPVLILVSGCGGKVLTADEDSPLPTDEPSATATTSPRPVIPEDGEWGTWQLLSLDLPGGGRNYSPPYVEIDLHPTGEAFLWHCTASTGRGQRCPYAARVGCLAGRISVTGLDWYIDFPATSESPSSRGLIGEEPSGDIFVDGSGLLPAGGHYVRVAAASFDRCIP